MQWIVSHTKGWQVEQAADYELESSDVVAYPCWYNSRLGSNSKVAGGGASDNIPNISDNIKSLPREIL